MIVTVRERVDLPIPREDVFDFVASEAGFCSFPGFGWVPGIERVVVEEGDFTTEGASILVTNTDGSRHREQVRIALRPARYGVRIHKISSAFRFLVRHVDERWDIDRGGTHADGAGARIHRSFAFALRSPLMLPIALPLGHVVFRAAMRRHHLWLLEWASSRGTGRGAATRSP